MYPNQKKIIIDKPKKNMFAVYGLKELAIACKTLSYSGLRVWLYLLSNNDKSEWYVSPAHAEKYWGISRSSFYRGWEELIEKGFLIEETIRQESNMEVSQIEKKKRASRIDTYICAKSEQSMSQYEYSNNTINNTNNNNGEPSNASVGRFPCHPEEDQMDALKQSELETILGDWWFEKVEGNTATLPGGAKVRVIFGE